MSERLEVITYNEIVGTHRWATQPEDAPHPYLHSPHRHRFTIETRWRVADADREVEIFAAENCIDKWLLETYPSRPDGVADMGDTSCEMLARAIVKQYASLGCYSCEVREDGRGGARYARQ